VLSNAEGGASQVSERKPAIDGHSPTVERRGMNRSGERKQASERGTHSLSSAEEGHVRTVKERQQARGTHQLSSGEGGNIRRGKKLENKGHSHPVGEEGRTDQDS